MNSSQASFPSDDVVTRGAQREILSGTGDCLASQTDSQRLHNVPGGVVHDSKAKGTARYKKHIVGDSDANAGASEGPQVDKAPGNEETN